MAFVLFVLAMIGTTVATDVVQRQSLATTWSGVNLPLLATDAMYFVGLFGLAVGYRRYWLVWSAGLQLACTVTHFGPLIDPATNAKLYRGLETVWILPMMLIMVVGIRTDRSMAELTPTIQPSSRFRRTSPADRSQPKVR